MGAGNVMDRQVSLTTAPHQPLAGFQGPISKGKGGEGKDTEGKGKGGERREGKEEMEREFGQVGQLYYCAPPAPSWISGAYF